MGPLSAIYSAILSARRFAYDSGLKKTGRLPARVISIGNLTLGGTGKTPAVIALAGEARRRGFDPCILTRGYRGRIKGPCFVRHTEHPRLNTSQAGDEPVLMAERLIDVPVIVGKDRYRSGLFALQNLERSRILFILDDGFQHWALHRDNNVLLIDATNPFGNGRLFPEGILREPLNALSRADTVVITKSDLVNGGSISACVQKIKQYNKDVPIYRASHKPVSIVDMAGEVRAVDELAGKKIYAFAGIGNPAHFKALLASGGADIAKFRVFKDHYNYLRKDIDMIMDESEGMEIITTEKDLVKIKESGFTGDLFALRIDFLVQDDFYKDLLGQ